MLYISLIASQLGRLWDAQWVPDTQVETRVTIGLKDWYGWMVVDVAGGRIAFLRSQWGLSSDGGVIVKGLKLSDSRYSFLTPYPSHFDTVRWDDYGIYGVIHFDGCALAVNAIAIVDEQSRLPHTEQLGGLVGPLYRLVIEKDTKLESLTQCTQ